MPKGLKDALIELRRDPKALKALKTAARNAKSPGFAVVWRLAERYDPDRPSDKHDVNVHSLEEILARSWEPGEPA